MKPIEPGQPLDCASARRLIDAFLLDELPADAGHALRRHLGGCVACTTELGGSTRLIALLGSLPVAAPAPDLDERVILAAIADRRRRHEHRSWLADLRVQVVRGAMRTTGTLLVTIATVAMLGGAFVFAAAQLFPGLPFNRSGATAVAPVPTPTPERVTAPAASPQPVNPTPRVIVITPPPTPAPASKPTAAPASTPMPTPLATFGPTPEPTASSTPTPQPTPTPTDKPRRTPPPSASPSPSDSATPSATPTPLP